MSSVHAEVIHTDVIHAEPAHLIEVPLTRSEIRTVTVALGEYARSQHRLSQTNNPGYGSINRAIAQGSSVAANELCERLRDLLQ
jgi:hypothetical protein